MPQELLETLNPANLLEPPVPQELLKPPEPEEPLEPPKTLVPPELQVLEKSLESWNIPETLGQGLLQLAKSQKPLSLGDIKEKMKIP